MIRYGDEKEESEMNEKLNFYEVTVSTKLPEKYFTELGKENKGQDSQENART